MDTTQEHLRPVALDERRYARCIEVSRRIRWDIDRDVIRGRRFDFGRKFLPDGLSQVDRIAFLDADGRRLLGQVQGRTYANMFGLFERFIGAKVLEVSRDHWLGDQTALEALVRFSEEELKHQELFRRLEALAGEQMPGGYAFLPQPNELAKVVLARSTWAVLALNCHIELFTQAHYRSSIDADDQLSELYRDVFLYHWKEESQHAILDELEWLREDAKLTPAQRDAAVDDLIELVGAIDGVLQLQSRADADYFVAIVGRALSATEAGQLRAAVLKAYRWQYILSGVREPRFQQVLASLVDDAQAARIAQALAPLIV